MQDKGVDPKKAKTALNGDEDEVEEEDEDVDAEEEEEEEEDIPDGEGMSIWISFLLFRHSEAAKNEGLEVFQDPSPHLFVRIRHDISMRSYWTRFCFIVAEEEDEGDDGEGDVEGEDDEEDQ